MVAAPIPLDDLLDAVRGRAGASSATGTDVTVYKGIGHPLELAVTYGLAKRPAGRASPTPGWPPSRAVDAERLPPVLRRPRPVPGAQRLVLQPRDHPPRAARAEGVVFDSENDTEVGARFVAARLAEGDDLEKALRLLCERFDGFYTLLVTTGDGFAVVRDAIACKPAIIAETDRLGRDGLGVPRPGRPAGHRRRPGSSSPSRRRCTHGSAD